MPHSAFLINRVLEERGCVIVSLFVRIDDDTLSVGMGEALKIVHGVTDDNFQRLADHIRLNDIVGGFQRLD